jgi:large subunit ribosomal protein L9
MEIILLEKVRNLGGLGDQVKVKAGFARNYLIPYGKAVSATAANRTKFEAQRAELERKHNESLGKSRERAEKLNGFTVQIVRKIAEDGTMYGSVTNRDIAEAVGQAGFVLERAEVVLSQGPLKTIGDHDVPLTLHPEVSVKIIVSVIGES